MKKVKIFLGTLLLGVPPCLAAPHGPALAESMEGEPVQEERADKLCAPSKELHSKLVGEQKFVFKFALVGDIVALDTERALALNHAFLFYQNANGERWLLFRRVGATSCLVAAGHGIVLPPGMTT